MRTPPLNRAPLPSSGERRRPPSWPLRWAGPLMGVQMFLFIIADLLRAPFVPVFVGSEVTERPVPPIVSAIHFAINLGLLIPPLLPLLLAREKVDLARIGPFLLLVSALLTVVVASVMAHPDAKAGVYAVILLLTLSAAALFVATPYGREEGFARFMAATSLAAAASCAIAIATNEYSWGRLAARAGPTYWGMVGAVAVAGSFAVRPIWLRTLVIGIAFATMVLASARGALVAGGLALMVMGAISFVRAPERQRGWYVLAAIVAVLVLPLVAGVAAEVLFKVDDPRRGVGSGATGRALAWAEAWQLFVNHPWLGIGYRQHERYITAATSAHEAYLAVLAELGAIGFALYLLMVLGGAVRITLEALRGRDAGSATGAAYLWGYLAIGLFENMALATGLLMPLVMLFVVARAWVPLAPPPAVPRLRRLAPPPAYPRRRLR